MNSMELSNYLERVRIGRKMNQETFVDGILSIRQYQRYRNGEGDIPYEKLELFAHKLGIPTRKLLSEFEKEKNIQLKLINDFYNAVVTRNEKNADNLRKKINHDIIIEEEKKRFFNHAMIIHERLNNRISKAMELKQNAQLINYPDVLKQTYYTDIEVLILSSLLELVEDKERQKLLNKLSMLFESEGAILSSNNPMIYTLILSRMIKNYGRLKQYGKVIELSDRGIERGKDSKQYYFWEYFYYYKAVAYYHLEDILQFEKCLFKCYNVLHMEGHHQKITRFKQWIQKEFDIDFDMFIMKYLKKNIL